MCRGITEFIRNISFLFLFGNIYFSALLPTLCPSYTGTADRMKNLCLRPTRSLITVGEPPFSMAGSGALIAFQFTNMWQAVLSPGVSCANFLQKLYSHFTQTIILTKWLNKLWVFPILKSISMPIFYSKILSKIFKFKDSKSVKWLIKMKHMFAILTLSVVFLQLLCISHKEN